VNPHSLRGTALTIAVDAAVQLGQHERARHYRSELNRHDESSGQRAASETQFNAVHELIQNGRLDEAEALLLAAWDNLMLPVISASAVWS